MHFIGRNNLTGWGNLLLLTLFLLQTFSYASGLNSDGLVLLSFKWSISSDPYSSLANWNDSDQTPCNWSGISCLEQDNSGDLRVVSLQLPQKGLAGSIPRELGQLTYLTTIDLRNNQLIGTLPPELFAALFLQNIILFGNHLSGNIPSQISNLKNLEHLNIGSNRLLGNIPDIITNCTGLLSLVLKENILTGKIPYGIGSNLLLLQQLDLSSNRLTGSIPLDLGDLSSLHGTLNLSDNQLSGPIPAALGKLPLGVILNLQYNDFYGPIPQIGALSNQGPTAFLGNPGLCGFPLKVECPSIPSEPENLQPQWMTTTEAPGTMVAGQTSNRSKVLSIEQVLAIAIGDVLGILVICLLFIYCFRQHASRKEKRIAVSSLGKSSPQYNESSLREGSERLSEATEHGDLVHCSKNFKFELDDLLKASAYVLGKSGTGFVYKAVLEGGSTVVVRSFGIEGDEHLKEVDSALNLMGRVCHPNIVRLEAYFWSIQEKLLIYKFRSGGNLANALQARRNAKGPLPWAKRLNIAKGAAQGLAYLHECGTRKCVHGDLKPSKILLDENMEACIADFNVRRLRSIASGDCHSLLNHGSQGYFHITESAKDSLHVFRSSPYQPPEASENPRPTQKWDIYAFGVILLELLTGKSLPVSLSSSELDLTAWIHTSSQGNNSISPALDPSLLLERMHVQHEMLEVLQIALSCVAIAPEQRPRMKQVAESLEKVGCPFLKL